MDTQIIVAIIALVGTAVGSFSGVLTATKLTTYRIAKLEEKVDKHNGVMERTFVLEQKCGDMSDRLEKIEGFVVYHNR